jgi:hypothetical protein
MPDDHEVTIGLIDNKHATPSIPEFMRVNDTVRYSSPDGDIRVKFEHGSPFIDANGDTLTEIHGSETLTLLKEGKFFCECFITPPGKVEVGWDPINSPQSGGEHNVGH